MVSKSLKQVLLLPAIAFAALTFAVDAGVAQTTQQNAQPQSDGVKRTTTTATYGGWVVSCVTNESTKDKNCSARLQMVNKERKPILAWFIGFNRNRVLMSELVTPTDVFIAPGVQVTLDDDKDNPIKLLYSACSVRGCQSSIPMTKQLRDRLVKAKKVNVAVAAINGKTFNFPVQFAGFDKALADLLQ